MDKSKAKKAVKKSESRKQAKEVMNALALQAATGLDPEIQAMQATMQPADGYVNPYHAMGAMAPMEYSPGNILNGYNFPMMVNPEA
jgi:hypothetical protein